MEKERMTRNANRPPPPVRPKGTRVNFTESREEEFPEVNNCSAGNEEWDQKWDDQWTVKNISHEDPNKVAVWDRELLLHDFVITGDSVAIQRFLFAGMGEGTGTCWGKHLFASSPND